MTPRRSRLARLLAALFIRGAEAPFILRDLDDAFNHDVARGLPPAEARRRDLGNVLASAGSVWAEFLRSSAWRPSLVDARLGLRTIVRTPGLSFVAFCALAIGIPVGLAPILRTPAMALGASVMRLVSLAACTVPTLRALRIAPMDALRQEG